MSKKVIVGALLALVSSLAVAHDDCAEKRGREFNKCRPNHVATAPEMQIASAGAALALLAGGIIVLRGRRTARKD
jgi:hypothetical protein